MLKKIASLWSGSIAGALLAFILQATIARSLTPINFGYLTSALALCNAIAPVATLGVAGFWPRVFGEEGNSASRWVPATIKYNIISTVAIYTALLMWAIWGPHSTQQQLLIAITSLHIFGYVAFELIITSLQIRQQYSLLSWWQAIPHLVRLVFALLLPVLLPTFVGAAASGAYALTAFIGVLALPIYLRPLLKHSFKSEIALQKDSSKPAVFEVVSLAWPYSAASLLYLLYLQIPIILTAYAIESAAAGYIGIVVSILSAAYLLPSALFQRLLLVEIHELAEVAPVKLSTLISKGVTWMFFLGFGFMAVLILVADSLIPLAFGVEYAPASYLLMIAAISLPFRFMSLPYDALLSTQANIHSKIRIMISIAALLTALTIALTSTFNTVGVVLALVAADIANWFWLRRRAASFLAELTH